MAVTTVYTYPLNGTVKDFGIPFEYLARRFVTVTLIGTDRKELTLTTDYRFTSKTNIQTTKAWGPADAYELVEIRRNTSATDRLVDFADGSILRAYELNIAQIQTMHIAEEARNMVTDTIGVNNAGMLDARARKIVNLADATEPGDAVTLRQQQAWAESALNQANRSKAEADRSTTEAGKSAASATAAKTSETNSKNSETAAKTSETNAKTSETNASAHRSAAKASEDAAKLSETNSKNSETSAKASEQAAAGYAAGVNMPSASGQAGKLLGQNSGGTGLTYHAHYTAYGLGSPSLPVNEPDLNNPTQHLNKRFMGQNMAGAPGLGWWLIDQIVHDGLHRVQVAYGMADNAERIRFRSNAGAWHAIHTSRDLGVDTVRAFGLAGGDKTLPYFRDNRDEEVLYLQRRLGFTPVRQGGGLNQSDNTLNIGWEGGAGYVRVSVDNTRHARLADDLTLPFLMAERPADSIGSYAFCHTAVAATPGTNVAGSNLYLAFASGQGEYRPGGTWRCMGDTPAGGRTLFLRIA